MGWDGVDCLRIGNIRGLLCTAIGYSRFMNAFRDLAR